MAQITQQECQERINRVVNTITLFDYTNTHKSGLHCSVCGQSWLGTPSAIFRGVRKCPVCTNQKIVAGYNDLWTTRPDVACLLQNPEDGYKYSFGSGKKVVFKCPDCGSLSKPLQLCLVTKHGFSCHNCGDGISIPNKFMSNLLKYFLQDDYEREKIFEWCKFPINGRPTYGIYDFYFKYQDKEYIVEMDGGLGHGNEFNYTPINRIRTKSEDVERDRQKDMAAKQHGVEVIRVDAKSSELDYLREQVLNSRLNDIFDLNRVNFDTIYEECLTSRMIQVIHAFNGGIHNTKQLAKRFKISLPTVITYLKRGQKIGICTYNPIESFTEEMKKRGKPVVCVTDNKSFDSISGAGEYYSAHTGAISRNCRHLQDYVTSRVDDRHLVFEYAS